MPDASAAREIFVTGLKNAHAMENQALSIMKPQLARLEHYPELAARLREHITETEGQAQRLDRILADAGESASSLKDTFLSAFGGMASLGHAAAGDEVLKNSFANHAFENYEIAAYISLITSAKDCGESGAISLLEQNLDEERRMADWIATNLPQVTEAYLRLRTSGESAKV